MILVVLNKSDFEYDVHSLVKAFFPEQAVKIMIHDTDTKDTSEEVEKNKDISIHLRYKDESICIKIIKECTVIDEDSILVDYKNRPETKNRLKQLLYQLLSKLHSKSLPWGTLTGIRPVKIPMTLLDNGKSTEEIKSYMKDTYFVSDSKADLSLSIAQREKRILEKADFKNGYSLYIGIPFCPTTCLYCSFTSYPISMWQNQVWDYLHALKKEMLFTAEEFQYRIPDTIYIGGGTPTTLTAEQLDYLLDILESCFDLDALKEFTVEAGRPDSITKDKLLVIKKHKVQRISINPQTMNQDTLDFIGRKHSVEQFLDSFHMARQIGFDNINMDIIIGLPKESISHVKHTLEVVEQLKPESLTVHSLAVKRASKLHQILKDDYSLPMVNMDEMMWETYESAKRLSMHPYYLYRQKNISGNLENIGYSLEDKYGIYNILIMEEVQTIAALGAGSISKYVDARTGRIERSDTVKDIGLYISQIDDIIEKKREFYQHCKEEN